MSPAGGQTGSLCLSVSLPVPLGSLCLYGAEITVEQKGDCTIGSHSHAGDPLASPRTVAAGRSRRLHVCSLPQGHGSPGAAAAPPAQCRHPNTCHVPTSQDFCLCPLPALQRPPQGCPCREEPQKGAEQRGWCRAMEGSEEEPRGDPCSPGCCTLCVGRTKPHQNC